MMKKYTILLVLILGLFLVTGCEEDSATEPDVVESDAAWVGSWLSVGSNVSAVLSTYYGVDSVEVDFSEDGIVDLRTHYATVGWVPDNGTYTVTESADSEIDVFWASYTGLAIEQEGIIQIISASPDTLRLEAVQTVPNADLTVPTPALGFGADPAWTDLNIQTFVRVE